MSALRQLLAWLWAAAWVRWRVAAVKARALFGGSRPATAAASGYYLSASEIPVEGVDYEPIDLPPELQARLDLARVELVDHARSTAGRRIRRRRARRRRTASLAMAALVTLAVLGAGATALVSGSTGVPAVDRLLGIYEEELEKPSASERSGPSGRGLQPEPSGSSVSVIVPAEDGVPRIVSTSYVSMEAGICSVLVRGDGPAGDLGCVAPRFLGERLDQGGALLGATEVGPRVVLRGFVKVDVMRLEGSGPVGRLDFRIGDIWKPGVEGIGPLRPFVAVDAGRHSPVVSTHTYRIRAVMGDGSRVQLAP